ncbi:50S ribosomal protein L17 [Geothermobacter hydrogeniphilus]|uniref:Large ribosomal subunit protein bL17 n=1 Tax=Geothermobacter hydrogeniphilus TaxID=1969733 RepID=A0A2K2HED9_9BACT|nr:50S ribosomal protein L17 [Geothermobacter hydrogeniphilus]
MRHRKAGRRLGRNSSHRKAMLRNMVTSLLQHEKITTTDARAKELRKLVEKMITLGKRGTLHARRQALQVIQDKKVVAKLFEQIAPRYQERPGGYTRIIKLGHRSGDNASMSIIELVEEELTIKPKKKKAAKKAEPKVEAPVVEETTTEEAPVEEAPVEEGTAGVEAAEEPAAEASVDDDAVGEKSKD